MPVEFKRQDKCHDIHEQIVWDAVKLVMAYDYRAFGERVTLAEANHKVTETFTGKELDDETALSNHGARMLDPMLGMASDSTIQYNVDF